MSSNYLEYVPNEGGAPCDPQPAGGAVLVARLYDTPARDGTPVATAGPATRTAPTVYRFDFTGPALVGRFWTEVEWRADAASEVFLDAGDRVDLPYDPRLVVSPEDVAGRLGVPLPLTAAQREQLVDGILDAQADVESELRRGIVPRAETMTGVSPTSTAYPMSDWRAWPVGHFGDTVRVVAYDPLDPYDGTWTLHLQVGLDGAAEAPIRRFVIAHTAETLRYRAGSGLGSRIVTSVSAEGQSVSYAASASDARGAGAAPTLDSLRRYKRAAIFRRDRPVAGLWPYSDTYTRTRW